MRTNHTDHRIANAKGKPMKSRLITTLLTAACAAVPMSLLPASAAQAQSVSTPANQLVLSVGRGQMVTIPGTVAEVFIANPQVADYTVKSSNQLYIMGKGGGETTIYASNARGDTLWSATIRVGTNLDSVDQLLRVAMPDAKISFSTVGTGTALLTGTVAAPEDAAEAERLVSAYLGKDVTVISRLKMATPLQVNLQVRFAEVSRSLVKSLGVNLTTIDGSNGFKFGLGQGNSPASEFNPGRAIGFGKVTESGVPDPSVQWRYDPVTGFAVDAEGKAVKLVTQAGTSLNRLNGLTTLAGAGKFLGLDLLGTLDAGETVGLVSTLAQPNLTALSGETADFLAGGEYPIPISQGLGTTSIEYKKYGVSLAYTPTVLANGRISIRVRPEVSELSTDGAVILNGFQVPALTIRRAETTVELGSGQSFMIAGLLKNNNQDTITKLPGAGDLPILGSLFRSTAFRKGETELVIVITPYLVNPVDANDIKLPTDGYKAPNELERILGNKQVSPSSGGDRPKPTAGPDKAPNPAVSSLDAPAEAPAQAAAPNAKGRTAAATQPATPGFNLN